VEASKSLNLTSIADIPIPIGLGPLIQTPILPSPLVVDKSVNLEDEWESFEKLIGGGAFTGNDLLKDEKEGDLGCGNTSLNNGMILSDVTHPLGVTQVECGDSVVIDDSNWVDPCLVDSSSVDPDLDKYEVNAYGTIIGLKIKPEVKEVETVRSAEQPAITTVTGKTESIPLSKELVSMLPITADVEEQEASNNNNNNLATCSVTSQVSASIDVEPIDIAEQKVLNKSKLKEPKHFRAPQDSDMDISSEEEGEMDVKETRNEEISSVKRAVKVGQHAPPPPPGTLSPASVKRAVKVGQHAPPPAVSPPPAPAVKTRRPPPPAPRRKRLSTTSTKSRDSSESRSNSEEEKEDDSQSDSDEQQRGGRGGTGLNCFYVMSCLYLYICMYVHVFQSG